MSDKKKPKRPYLTRNKRRLALLEAATKIVDDHGWRALSMSALADEAKVSRQLVYQHFPSLGDLMIGTATFIFSEVYQANVEAMTAPGGRVADVTLASTNAIARLPRGRRQAFWQILSINFKEDDEISDVSRRLRGLVSDIGAEHLSENLGVDEKRARGIIWMLSCAFWATMLGEDDGSYTREEAEDMWNWMARRVLR